MVMLRYGDGITEINGKVGGEVYRRDRCGNHKQTYNYEHHEPSPAQRKRRRCFSKLLRRFLKIDGTEENIKRWWIWSYNHPKTNKKGETYYLNPLMAYLSYNIPRCVNDVPIHPYPMN